MATLLLAGVAVNAFLGAVVSAIIILLPDNGALREILFWLVGGLDSRSWEHVRISAPPIVGGTVVILLMARDLNLLMLGDDEARSMGVRVGFARVTLLAASALATGAAVAVSGTIAFVGLVTPHVLRLMLGPDHRVLIPLSAAGGAVFVIVCRHRGQDHRPAGRVPRRRPHRIRRRAVLHSSVDQEQPSDLLVVSSGFERSLSVNQADSHPHRPSDRPPRHGVGGMLVGHADADRGTHRCCYRGANRRTHGSARAHGEP